jgi:hypothetical protein
MKSRRPCASRESVTRLSTLEETPEQVLARLERYAASLRPPAPRAPAPIQPRVPAARTWTIESGTTARTAATPPISHQLLKVGFEAGGYFLLLVCAVTAILTFQRLDQAVASLAVLGLVLGGLIATIRRIPLALWWTLGFAIGGLIARLS